MLKRLNKKFWLVIYALYAVIFGKGPGLEARNFMKDLTIVFMGLILSKVFSLVFQILSGRLLGTVEYGKFALVFSTSNLIWTVMYLAIGTAMVKYMASVRSDNERSDILSTGVILSLVMTVVFSVAFYAASYKLSSLFSIGIAYIYAAILMAISINVWTMSQKVCQGLNMNEKLSAINIVSSLFTLCASIVLYLYIKSAIVPISVMIVGFFISSILVLPELRKYMKFRINRKWFRILVRYSLLGFIGTITFSSIGAINKIIINTFLTIGDVGLFQAYYFSTLTFSTFFVTGFMLVFFPTSLRYRKKFVVFFRINRFIRMTPFMYIALFVLSFIVMSLYGGGYLLSFRILAIFVFAGVTISIHSIYIWFSASMGMEGVKISSMIVSFTILINVLAALFLIPRYGLQGAAVSIVLSYIIGNIFAYFSIRSLVKHDDTRIEHEVIVS
ncbi:MAG: oligosaccharide flippase family protein [Candidatus Cloacimonetes bacterium]|nr:oligosaccharide flippase family protein [Candidatus Cloacimonadota bacterium]